MLINGITKASGNLWKYYRDEPFLDDNGTANFPAANSALFKFKQKIASETSNDGRKIVETMVPLIYLINFWGTLFVKLISF